MTVASPYGEKESGRQLAGNKGTEAAAEVAAGR